MSLITGENVREPWSRITDSRILRPGDELRLVTPASVAIIGVLDSHNPRANFAPGYRVAGIAPVVHNHHHILVQMEGEQGVLSSGMYIGAGEPEELIFLHMPLRQAGEEVAEENLRRMRTILELGNHGLYYASDQEQVSATAQGQAYLNPDGGLLI